MLNLSSVLQTKRGVSENQSSHQYYIKDIEFHANYLYFSWSLTSTNFPYSTAESGIARISLPNGNEMETLSISDCEWAWTTTNISGITVFEITDSTIYYFDGNSVKRSTWTVEPNGTISLTGSDSYTLNGSSLGLGANEYVTISDMQLNGSMLYITVYRYDTSVSNGGILKFPVDSDTFEPAVWSQNIPVPKIFGWYKSENETVQPPLNQATKYFYGARKFIAKKPDELVIADDGAFIANNEVYFKTRVATVNLLTESLSMVDVNVTFSSSFFCCGGVKVQ